MEELCNFALEKSLRAQSLVSYCGNLEGEVESNAEGGSQAYTRASSQVLGLQACSRRPLVPSCPDLK